MSKIRNIGILDVRDISEEMASRIDKMENIGILIESDRSQTLLANARRINIGETLTIPLDKNISFAKHNGIMEIDREYLEMIEGQVAFLINGHLTFKNDISPSLLNEKIFLIKINGKMICPKNLKGLIQTKTTINGIIGAYESDYTYIDGETRLDNKFLKAIEENSKLSFSKLLVLDSVDEDLLREKAPSIEIIDKLVIGEDLEDQVEKYMKDYYLINKVILPNLGGEIKVINKDITIDNMSLRRYNRAVLYIEGKCSINIDEAMDFQDHISYIKADKVIVSRKNFDRVYRFIDTDTDIEILDGRLMRNSGKLILSGVIENPISIENMGKISIDKNIDVDSFNNNVLEIKNYGKIVAPEEILPLIKGKIILNNGKVSASLDREEEILLVEEDLLYENLGELKL